MARINIEDKLINDPRFFKLALILGSKTMAVGACWEAFRLAQDYWFPDKKPIPLEVAKRLTTVEHLLTVDLARRTETGVYICGSEEQFLWLFQRRNAGKKSANARLQLRTRCDINEKTDSAEIITENIEQPFNGRSTGVNSSQPLSLSLSLTTKTNTKTIAHPRKIASERVIKFDAMLEEVYRSYPRKLGKSAGMKKLKAQIKTENDIENLKSAIQNFVKYLRDKKTEPNFIPYFSTFVTSWRDWLESDTGKTALTAAKPPQDDEYIKQLEQIRRQS